MGKRENTNSKLVDTHAELSMLPPQKISLVARVSRDQKYAT